MALTNINESFELKQEIYNYEHIEIVKSLNYLAVIHNELE